MKIFFKGYFDSDRESDFRMEMASDIGDKKCAGKSNPDSLHSRILRVLKTRVLYDIKQILLDNNQAVANGNLPAATNPPIQPVPLPPEPEAKEIKPGPSKPKKDKTTKARKKK